jgi:hypothetical protein
MDKQSEPRPFVDFFYTREPEIISAAALVSGTLTSLQYNSFVPIFGSGNGIRAHCIVICGSIAASLVAGGIGQIAALVTTGSHKKTTRSRVAIIATAMASAAIGGAAACEILSDKFNAGAIFPYQGATIEATAPAAPPPVRVERQNDKVYATLNAQTLKL